MNGYETVISLFALVMIYALVDKYLEYKLKNKL